MNQLGLDFTPLPQTHTGDPPTSHRAEARLRASGVFSLQQAATLDFVDATPGLTSTEIAARIAVGTLFDPRGHERLCQIRKRLSVLKKKKLVRSQSTPGEDQSRWFSTGV